MFLSQAYSRASASLCRSVAACCKRSLRRSRRPGDHVASVGTRADLLAEIRSLRREHNFSPDNAIESVGFALFAVLPSDAFACALEALPPELRELWSGVGKPA